MAEANELPTAEELLKLSRRGMVAYAVRAARRVQPLFQADEQGGITEEHVAAVDRAITLAERFVSVAHPVVSGAELRAAADSAARARSAAFSADSATFAADSATFAADSAAFAADSASRTAGFAADSARAASFAADSATRTIVVSVRTPRAAVSAARTFAFSTRVARRDYEFLLKLSQQPAPELGDIIDLVQLGPLWPEGEPVESLRPSALAFASSPLPEPPTVSPPWLVLAWNPELVSEEEYARLVTSLGDLVRAEGGAGIQRLREMGFTVELPAGVLQ